MTALSSLLEVRNTLENPAVPISSSSIVEYIGGDRKVAGVSVNERSALGMPAVWRAVNLISGTCASLPLKAYKKGDETRLPLTTGTAAELLDDPHPDMTDFELWETVYSHIALWGNAYLRTLRNQLGVVTELWPIHPGRVKAGRTSEIGEKVYEVDGKDAYTDEEILHIPGFGYDGICGCSPIRVARQAVALGLAAEQFGASLFANGTLAAGILQTEQRLKSGEADAIKARWKAKRAGIDNAHDVIVLDRGAKFQQLSIPPEDAQFIESRQFQIYEVCRMFGVPAFLMFETTKSTSWGTGLEQQAIGWVKFDLRRWYIRVERRLSRVLGPSTVYVKYSVEGLLRGDSTARAAFYKSMWDIGAFSTNDILELEDRAKVEGGDARYRPLNMGQLGEYDTTTQEAPADATV